jgi:pimeloyl-ACP methyl ester carboxylesterase
MTPPAQKRPSPPIPLETLRVRSADGIEIHVEIHGNPDGPTVVLSHGWTCSIRFWWPVIAELAADYRLVTYDQRGHGGSGRPGPDQYSVPALAEDLTAVLDAAAGPDQFILVGHSMGGMAVMAAGQNESVRARTRAILLASTGAHGLAGRSNLVPGRHLAGFLVRRMLRDPTPLGRRTRLSTRLLAYGTLGPKPGRALAAENATIIHACPRHTRAGWGRVIEVLDVREGMAALTAPTAVLVGTADRLTPPRHAEELAETLANLHSKTVLPKVGHMSPMERPSVVAALVRGLDTATATSGAALETGTVPAAAPAAAQDAAAMSAVSGAPIVPSAANPQSE